MSTGTIQRLCHINIEKSGQLYIVLLESNNYVLIVCLYIYLKHILTQVEF